MQPILFALFAFLKASVRSRASIQLEILALRHQLAVYHRSVKRPRLRPADRILRAWIARIWPRWREPLVIVQPDTGAATRLCLPKTNIADAGAARRGNPWTNGLTSAGVAPGWDAALRIVDCGRIVWHESPDVGSGEQGSDSGRERIRRQAARRS